MRDLSTDSRPHLSVHAVNLVELLASLGIDLGTQEQSCVERLRQGTAAEKVRAMHLLCALGPTTDEGVAAILETDVGRLWRLEWKRVEALLRQRQRALPLVIAALAHAEEGVRARAEAVLEAMGPEAHEAVPALLAMPAWEGPNGDWPSPALYTVGEAGRSHLKEALEHPSPVVRGRAELVLDTLTSPPE